MDLAGIRRKIDGIDDELLALFLKRMELSRQVAKHKQSHNLPIFSPEREREIIARMRQAAGSEMGGYTEEFFTTIMELSKKLQTEWIGRP